MYIAHQLEYIRLNCLLKADKQDVLFCNIIAILWRVRFLISRSNYVG